MEKDRSCVIVVENLPVPFDRRVWQEAKALKKAGWHVSVICPRSDVYPLEYEEIDSITIYRHSLPLEAKGLAGFVVEYATALFHEFRLLIKAWRRRRFSVIQVCNPPDLLFLVALPFKLLGVNLIFDQHDAVPMLYISKFGGKGLVYRILTLFERLSFFFADFVFFANDTFRDAALQSRMVPPELTQSVYGICDRSAVSPVEADLALRKGKKFVLGYLGIIGDQDGVDQLVRAVHYLSQKCQFEDFHVVVVGDGPALPSVVALASELGVDRLISFVGYKVGEELQRTVGVFDIGVIPDPVNPTNDMMTMNKVFEYSQMGIAIASYNLRETRRLLGAAAVYSETSEPDGLGAACMKLMRDDDLRASCAERARDLAKNVFLWEREAKKYTDAYANLLSRGSRRMDWGSLRYVLRAD